MHEETYEAQGEISLQLGLKQQQQICDRAQTFLYFTSQFESVSSFLLSLFVHLACKLAEGLSPRT